MRPLQQLLLGALRADDVVRVRDEAASDQRRLARGADEAVVVPVPVLERDESGATDSCAMPKYAIFSTESHVQTAVNLREGSSNIKGVRILEDINY